METPEKIKSSVLMISSLKIHYNNKSINLQEQTLSIKSYKVIMVQYLHMAKLDLVKLTPWWAASNHNNKGELFPDVSKPYCPKLNQLHKNNSLFFALLWNFTINNLETYSISVKKVNFKCVKALNKEFLLKTWKSLQSQQKKSFKNI